MGLCKCPKRKVTNQFCFEHRVNVCEHCMVTNHPKCVVQSYLQWLRDSDCNPICTLCSEALKNKDCIRLTCYHVFHWPCLDVYSRNLPATTAPAGYTCPTCFTCIFPEANLVSPVADVLREKLAGVNWARAGLGLPLLSDERERKPVQESKASRIESSSYQNHTSTPTTTTTTTTTTPTTMMTTTTTTTTPTTLSSSSMATSRTGSGVNSQSTSGVHNANANSQKLGPPYSIVNMESNMPTSNPTARKIFEAYDDPKDISFDHDENKYQRKSAIDWFIRWWNLITRPPPRRRNTPGSLYKRYAILGAIGIFVFILIIVLFSWLGRMATDGDPSYNLMANPNINVEQEAIEPR